MNEELIDYHANHCDFYVGNEHWDKSFEEQQRLWVHKFAELIVQECADIAKHNVMNISTYSDAEFVDKQIKEHFGVEE